MFLVGWVYNLKTNNVETSTPRLFAIGLTFTTLAASAIALRFWVRLRRSSTRNIGWDDLAALSSLIFSIFYTIIAIYQTRWGQGLDPNFFPPENIIPFSKVQYAGGPTYCLALLGFKVSLLAAYLRIAGILKHYRPFIYAAIAIVTANQIIFTCLLSFACRPIAKQWNPALPGHCINQLASYFALAGTSLTLDIIILALPFPVLAKLQMAWRKKVAVGGIILLGLFVTMTQIFRIFTIDRLKSYTNSEPIVVWSMIEINVGIIVCSIPSYAPLFRFARKKFSSNKNKYVSYEMGKGDSRVKDRDTTNSKSQATRVVCETESEEAIIWGGDHTIVATTEWSLHVEDKDKKKAASATVSSA